MRAQATRAHDEHVAVSELLPWYVNRTLKAQDLHRVEAHLTGCGPCQDELARCEVLAEAVQGQGGRPWVPTEQHFARLLERIEAADGRRVAGSDAGSHWRSWFDEAMAGLRAVPRVAQVALALEAALVLGLTVLLVWPGDPAPRLYETLSRRAEMARADRLRIRVVFSEDITEKELRGLLTGLDAEIVQGPTPLGVYTITSPSSHPEAAGSEGPLQAMRAHPKVRLAERVPPPGQP